MDQITAPASSAEHRPPENRHPLRISACTEHFQTWTKKHGRYQTSYRPKQKYPRQLCK